MDFSLLLILLFIVAFLLRVDFIFYVIYVAAGVYLWSRWRAPRVLRHLHASRHYHDHAFWSEKVTITLRLRNSSRLPTPWLQLNESAVVQLGAGGQMRHALSLRGRETAVFSYQVQAHQRGHYRIGPMQITTGDLFGFQANQTRFLAAATLTVYPRILPLAQLNLPSRLPFGALPSQQRLFADPARPMGNRAFQSGDSLRSINWKTSAHTNQLMVKTYEPAISLQTAVLLNLHAPNYQRQNRAVYTEQAIETAASLAARLISQKQPVGLITNGADPLAGDQESLTFDKDTGRLHRDTETSAPLPPAIPPRNGRPHLMKILERLARIESAETVPFAAWIPTACVQLGWGTTILAITGRGDAQTAQALHHLVRAGLNPALITVEPDANFSRVQERARQLGFAAYNITSEAGLKRGLRPLPGRRPA